MDVLARLRELQNEYGWSDYYIAKKAGLSQTTVSNAYKRNNVPNVYTLDAICKAFGLTLSQFFAENEMVEMTPEMRRLFDGFKKLSPAKRAALLHLLETFTD